MTTTPTQYTKDGVEILAIQQGHAPHPHPVKNGALVPFRWLEELLLADGTTRFRCGKPANGVDGPICGRDDFVEVKSAVSHMNSHGRRPVQRYDDDVLRHLIRLVRTYEAAGWRGFYIETAEELNGLKVPTLDGTPWTASQVSNLFYTYSAKFTTRVHRSEVLKRLHPSLAANAVPANPVALSKLPDTPPADTHTDTSADAEPTPKAAEPMPTTSHAERTADNADRTNLAALSRRSTELVTRVSKLFDDTRQIAADFADFVDDTGKLLTELASRPDADPEVLEKARNWDQIKGMLAK